MRTAIIQISEAGAPVASVLQQTLQAELIGRADVARLWADVDAFIFPQGVGRWTSMGDTETVMFESCEHKEAAFEWMAYLATGKGQETWCTVTGNVPVAARVQELPQFQDNRFMKVSIEGTPVAGILPVLDTTTQWISDWPATIQKALLGETTAEECMKTLQAAMWEE